jgi:predicted amidohydrolase YtcJ
MDYARRLHDIIRLADADYAAGTRAGDFGDRVGVHACVLAARAARGRSRHHARDSVQPYHAIDDGRWAERRIGPERIRTTYAFRTLLDAGVRLSLGTDWSVAPLNPMMTLYAATTRATLDGKNPDGWVPEEKITIREAVAAYTSGSAFAEFQEGEKGAIVRGRLADLVILSEDVFSIPPARIKEVSVLTTVVGGKVVHQRNP